jgi:hypothetical protein
MRTLDRITKAVDLNRWFAADMSFKTQVRIVVATIATLAVAAFAFAFAGCSEINSSGGSAIEKAAARENHADGAVCVNEGPIPGDSDGSPVYGCELKGGYHDGERLCAQYIDGEFSDETDMLRYADDVSGEHPFDCT